MAVELFKEIQEPHKEGTILVGFFIFEDNSDPILLIRSETDTSLTIDSGSLDKMFKRALLNVYVGGYSASERNQGKDPFDKTRFSESPKIVTHFYTYASRDSLKEEISPLLEKLHPNEWDFERHDIEHIQGRFNYLLRPQESEL